MFEGKKIKIKKRKSVETSWGGKGGTAWNSSELPSKRYSVEVEADKLSFWIQVFDCFLKSYILSSLNFWEVKYLEKFGTLRFEK